MKTRLLTVELRRTRDGFVMRRWRVAVRPRSLRAIRGRSLFYHHRGRAVTCSIGVAHPISWLTGIAGDTHFARFPGGVFLELQDGGELTVVIRRSMKVLEVRDA